MEWCLHIFQIEIINKMTSQDVGTYVIELIIFRWTGNESIFFFSFLKIKKERERKRIDKKELNPFALNCKIFLIVKM